MKAIAELFDSTVVLVPCFVRNPGSVECPLVGPNLSVVPLTVPAGVELRRKIAFPFWFLRNLPRILRQFRQADAIHAPIPGDIGTVGMILALIFRKPLFVRHCGNWLKRQTWADHFWAWFMLRYAGERNVMLATGGGLQPPSAKNPNVRWIFSTSLTQQELQSCPQEHTCPTAGPLRLIIVARQEKAKGAGTVIQSLPLLVRRFPEVSFEIVGDGSAIAEFKQIASQAGVAERVLFSGKLNHEQVLHRLRDAHLFVFPTTSSEGFPKAVLEALASGLPVAATQVSVLPYLLGNGCGILLDDATPEAVARGVEQALHDPGRYASMSRKGIETARQYSLESWQDAIRSYLEAAWGPLKGEVVRSRKSEVISPVIGRHVACD